MEIKWSKLSFAISPAGIRHRNDKGRWKSGFHSEEGRQQRSGSLREGISAGAGVKRRQNSTRRQNSRRGRCTVVSHEPRRGRSIAATMWPDRETSIVQRSRANSCLRAFSDRTWSSTPSTANQFEVNFSAVIRHTSILLSRFNGKINSR